MRIFQITEDTRKDIAKLINFANKNKFNISQLKLIMAGDLAPAGDNPDYVVHIHDGFRVVYSIEEHPSGWFHHISISIDKKNKYPHEIAVQEILKEFKLNPDFNNPNSHTWIDDSTQSINIIQKI